jgi:pSer/pThr/pTyr-binding forkhead associated (FHA) protein
MLQGKAVQNETTRRLRLVFQEIDLAEGSFVIGRSPSCDLALEDPLISRRHARIQVTKDDAMISDLGSRNGTLVNGEPLFDNHPLHHRDRIGIGNHEILFLEDRKCGASPLVVAEPEARRPQRGLAGARGDDTISLQMGGASPRMVSSMIDKAMTARRFDHAARLLEGKLEDYTVKASRGVHDIALLAEIAPSNARLAAELRDGSRLAWIFAAYARAGAAMPEAVLTQLLEAARGWYAVARDVEGYLRAIEGSRSSCEPSEALLRRMREIVRS